LKVTLFVIKSCDVIYQPLVFPFYSLKISIYNSKRYSLCYIAFLLYLNKMVK